MSLRIFMRMADPLKTHISMACLGRTYSAWWHVRDGQVRVEADFGFRLAPLEANVEPQILAEMLFRHLVRSQAARRATSRCAVQS